MARSNRLSKNLTIIFFVIAFLLATFFPWAASVLADPMVQDDDAAAGESESQFFDQIDVDLVNLDVVVTDRKGQPVAGLTREDFDILIDGAPVELHNFFEVTGTAAEVETSGAAPLADAPDATPQASRPALSNRVIFVDNRNIRPENRKLLFDKLQDHLATDASPARTMLVTMGRKLEIAVPFTEESSRIAGTLDELARQAPLHAILDSERRMFISRLGNAPLHPYDPPESTNDILVSTPGSDAVGGSLEAARDPDFDDAVRRALNLATDVRRLAEKRYQHAQTTAAALGQFCETLGGMPGRKALIYLSDGIPMRPADSLIESFTGKFQNWIFTYGDDIRRNSSYPDADRTFQQVMNALASSEFDLSQEIRQLTSRASANRVAFYPISNSGGNAGFVSAAVSGATINEGSGSGLRNAQSSENFSRDASLLVMAEDTGGQALTRSANIGELLERSARDFTRYYSLGYHHPGKEQNRQATSGKVKSNKARSSKVRSSKIGPSKIVVRVARDDVVVRHGKTYQPRSWRDRLGAMTLASALFEVEDNALGAALDPGEPVLEGDRYRVPIMIRIPFEQIRMVYRDEHYRGQLTALVVVRDDTDGAFSQPQRIDFPIKIPGQRIMEAAQREAGYLLQLDMERGAKRVAIGIRDHLARTEATLHLDLVVGDDA